MSKPIISLWMLTSVLLTYFMQAHNKNLAEMLFSALVVLTLVFIFTPANTKKGDK